jgi:peptidoglycan/xylan/chitin deacetylase (PgdA/CDA1 family)
MLPHAAPDRVSRVAGHLLEEAVDMSRRRLAVVGMALLVVTSIAPSAVDPPSAVAATNPTVVSLTFDDGDADQMAAAQTMAGHGLAGTFYITTGWIGAEGYLSQANLATLAASGNEIGGHTVTHADLTQISSTEVQAQICNGRDVLEGWGYQPTSFAYPFSTANASVEQLAAQCGYTTSRGLGDIRSPASCADCPTAESMPPADPQYLKAPDQVDSTWTLDQLKAQVTNASSGNGGWVILTFHHICDAIGTANCQADQSTTSATFNAFVAWLAAFRADAANNTVVQTVDQTVRQYMGAGYPAYQSAQGVPPRAPAAAGANALLNPSLETTDAATGFPSCFQAGGWGTNTPAWAAASPGRTGTVAQQLGITGYADGDAKLLPNLDIHTCAPTVEPGKTYNMSTWYQSTGITQFALYYRDASYAWRYWTSSPWFAAAPTWTEATFTTPPVPAGANAMTFGLALIQDGTLLTDDYSLVEPAPNAPATTSAPAPGGGGQPTQANPQPTDEVLELPGGSAVQPNTPIAAEPEAEAGGAQG